MQVFTRLSRQADDVKLDRALLDDAATRQHLVIEHRPQLQLSRNSQPDGPATHKGDPILRTAPSPLRAALSASGSAGISGFPASGRLPMIVLTKPSGPLLDDAATLQRFAAGHKLRLQLSQNGQPDGPATHKGKPDGRTASLPLRLRTGSIGPKSSARRPAYFFTPSRRMDRLQ